MLRPHPRSEGGGEQGLVGVAVVDDLEGDLPVGEFAVRFRGDVAEVSYSLAAPARGKGYASAALRAVCAWLEERDDLTRTEALMHPANQMSRLAARRAGFVEAGLRSTDATFADDGQVVVLVRTCR